MVNEGNMNDIIELIDAAPVQLEFDFGDTVQS